MFSFRKRVRSNNTSCRYCDGKNRTFYLFAVRLITLGLINLLLYGLILEKGRDRIIPADDTIVFIVQLRTLEIVQCTLIASPVYIYIYNVKILTFYILYIIYYASLLHTYTFDLSHTSLSFNFGK